METLTSLFRQLSALITGLHLAFEDRELFPLNFIRRHALDGSWSFRVEIFSELRVWWCLSCWGLFEVCGNAKTPFDVLLLVGMCIWSTDFDQEMVAYLR